jgi:hypothetical protein
MLAAYRPQVYRIGVGSFEDAVEKGLNSDESPEKHPSGAKQAAEKGQSTSENHEDHTSGAEAPR